MQITIFPKVAANPAEKEKEAAKAVQGEVSAITSRDEFINLITSYAWSSSIFKDDKRGTDNFKKSYFIAFDIDDGLSLSDAINMLKQLGYTCIIGTSINHQKEKDGVVADRYRVIFPLKNPITTVDDYRTTWLHMAGHDESMLKEADQSCKDPARFFFPCQKASIIEGYRKLEVIKSAARPKQSKKNYIGERGRLSSRTKKFMEEGAGPGSRHHEFILSVMDMKAQNYTKEETLDIMTPLMKKIKPEENVLKQVNDIYDKYKVEFDYREDK